ncbi:transposase [Streptomyces hypolithicus]
MCRAVWAEDAPGWIREIEAVHLLRQVLVQTYIIRSDTRGRQVIRKRDADDGVPPGQLRLVSPYDRDARWAAKGDDLFWMGYKIHLTETCTTLPSVDAVEGAGVMPNLITDVYTTDATVPDVKATAPIQKNLAERDVKPAEHCLDSGFPSADLITKALKQGIRMVTPVLLDRSAQAKAAEGFDKNAFTINWKTRQVRCPAGKTSSHWNPVKQHGTDAIVITFSVLTCRDCPFQKQCTTSKTGRRNRISFTVLRTTAADTVTTATATAILPPAGPAELVGTIGRAVLDALHPARHRHRVKARTRKNPTSTDRTPDNTPRPVRTTPSTTVTFFEHGLSNRSRT